MKALQNTDSTEQSIRLTDIPKPILQKDEVLVKVKAAAFNRRDYWISVGKYPKIKPFCTLGSDACGVVESVENEADADWIGREVILNPNNDWGENEAVQSDKYHILGMPTNGTMAEYLAIQADRLHLKPTHLDSAQAAALPLAGLTAYRALFRYGQISQDSKVLITGIGGGVALFALQFAVALGAKVWVSSSQETKIEKARKMGAVGGENYQKADFLENLAKESGGFDVVIDSAGGDNFAKMIKIMRPAGKIVFYGATQGLPSNLDLYKMFFRQITIQGSSMGNDQEFVDMLALVNKYKIVPVIGQMNPFLEAVSVLQGMKNSEQFGKLVVLF